MRLLIMLVSLYLTAAFCAVAETPRAVASIPPVGALLQRLTGSDAVPAILLDKSASAHHSSLRPSQLRALRRADLVIQAGAGLEPWLDRVKASSGATWLVLAEVPGTLALPARNNGLFGAADPASGADPHMWLDPQNAAVWLAAIADELTERDPGNAAIYAARLDAAIQVLAAVEFEIAGRMKALGGTTIIYAHDAFQYFENRFGLNAAGSLSGANAETPGAATAAALAGISNTTAVCVVHDATEGNALARGLFPGATRITADPMGWGIPLDHEWFSVFYRGLAAAFEGCLQ